MFINKCKLPNSTLDDVLKKMVEKVTEQEIVRTTIVEGGNKTHKKHIKVLLSNGKMLLIK